MPNPATIANGGKVRFLRTEHNLEHFAATVIRCHRLYDGEGHHYEIDCPGYPSIIGFAHDDELFINPADADAVSAQAKKLDAAKRREILLAERAKIDREIAVIDAAFNPTNPRKS